jgi:hypothetical protein
MREVIWAPIPGFPRYEVSTEGEVRSLNYNRTGKVKTMRQRMLKEYLVVKFSIRDKYKVFRVHQLVAMAFLGHVPNGNGLEVDHIDNDKLNNSLDNLQIITNRANISKAFAINRDLPTGVSYDKSRGLYRSRIGIEGKQVFLGRFRTAEEASSAYQKALKEIL